MIRRVLAVTAVLFLLPVPHASVRAQDVLTVLHPTDSLRIARTRMGMIVGQIQPPGASRVELLVPFRASVYLRASSKVEKDRFAPAVKAMITEGVIIERAVFATRAENEKEDRSRTYIFDLAAAVGLQKFWNSAEFQDMYAQVYKAHLSTVRLVLQGWTIRTIDATTADAHVNTAGFFVYSVSLEPGENTFLLRAADSTGKMHAVRRVRFFYQTDFAPAPTAVSTPRILFHGSAFPDHCAGCHDIEIPAAQVRKGASVEQFCAPCHTPLVSQASKHFPAAEWDCTACHDPGARPKFSLYADTDFATKACLGCHGDIEEMVEKSPIPHPPAGDRCGSCHDPHGSTERRLLVGGVRTICTSCHEGADKPHPVANHPVETVVMPSEAARPLDCASCHRPHGASIPKLLASARKDLCKNCHDF